MNDILTKLRDYKQHDVTKTFGPPLNPNDYEYPDSVKETLDELNETTLYEWGLNKITFHYKLNDRNKITFKHSEESCDTLFHYVARMLHVIQPKNIPITAIIILSSATKYYPEDHIFGPDHVNTGFANDKHIVIYRKEEWFKVFIHECFHFFKYDNVLFDESLKTPILDLFRVTSDVNLYESYCEIWARTLNCCMASVMTNISLSTLLEREKKYSVRHMVNVLNHMGLTYEKLFEKNNFREHTNILAYVVIGAILMHHDFLMDNSVFEITDKKKYVMFILDHSKSKSFLDMVHHIENGDPHVTTTMSLVTF